MGEIIIADEPVVDAVFDELTTISPRVAKDGGEPRYDQEAKYVFRKISSSELERDWDQFRYEMEHRARFFNRNAREFLDRLMQDVYRLRTL